MIDDVLQLGMLLQTRLLLLLLCNPVLLRAMLRLEPVRVLLVNFRGRNTPAPPYSYTRSIFQI